MPVRNRSAGSRDLAGVQAVVLLLRDGNRAQHQRMRSLHLRRARPYMILHPTGEDRRLHCALAPYPARCIFHAVADGLVVNVHADVIHLVLRSLLGFDSESAALAEFGSSSTQSGSSSPFDLFIQPKPTTWPNWRTCRNALTLSRVSTFGRAIRCGIVPENCFSRHPAGKIVLPAFVYATQAFGGKGVSGGDDAALPRRMQHWGLKRPGTQR